jgi:para-aminobenzoate synthetase component 1
VTGAPKTSALKIIDELETARRGPYCGGIGWVDADHGTAELAVGIRTFWIDRTGAQGPVLRFGTGAGITWGSDPEREWEETELKAARLLAIASGTGTGGTGTAMGAVAPGADASTDTRTRAGTGTDAYPPGYVASGRTA